MLTMRGTCPTRGIRPRRRPAAPGRRGTGLVCRHAVRSEALPRGRPQPVLPIGSGRALRAFRRHLGLRQQHPPARARRRPGTWKRGRSPRHAVACGAGRDVIVCPDDNMTGVRMLKRYLKGARAGAGASQGPPDQVDALPDGAGRRGPVPADKRQHRARGSPLRPRVVLRRAGKGAAEARGPPRGHAGRRRGRRGVTWNIVADRFKEAFSIIDFGTPPIGSTTSASSPWKGDAWRRRSSRSGGRR